jgi:hypothetical protein
MAVTAFATCANAAQYARDRGVDAASVKRWNEKRGAVTVKVS